MPGRRSIPTARASGPTCSTSAAVRSARLHGIPLAVKDIIATKTMPTTCGSPIYRDHVVGKDAACVTQLVKAGAIVLGKSVTTEFAGGHAGKTHNPHNLRHTPAGSSSGSAAAVADFMAPMGYGTQTAGSVIRPGAFNGVVAYKGSYGWADMTGIKPYAPSLDTLGFFAREANDLALIRAAYGHAPADPPTPAAAHRPDPHAVVGRWPSRYNRKNIEEAARTLRAAGARVREWQAPDTWDGLMQAQHRIMTKEATQSYAKERARFSHLFSPIMHGVMAEGDAVNRRPVCRRPQAQAPRPGPARRRLEQVRHPAGAVGQGRGAVGPGQYRRSDLQPLLDACSARPASRCPSTPGRSACRLSVQLVGPRGKDDQLIAWARWVERKLS